MIHTEKSKELARESSIKARRFAEALTIYADRMRQYGDISPLLILAAVLEMNDAGKEFNEAQKNFGANGIAEIIAEGFKKGGSDR